MDFLEQNKKDWIEIQDKIFPKGLPERCEWTDRNEIVNVLKIIGSIRNSNHMFFPRGGGLDVEGANISSEENCIEIDTGGLYDILKPSRLIFHSFKAEHQWNYFRLETLELKPFSIYEEKDYSDEELCELSPGNYISRTYWDAGEYQGQELPSTARVVTRHFRGSFVIFQKTSIYNHNSRTYDGRHNKMTDEEFRKYIQDVITHLKGTDWNG
jgi:serine/threonine-protein kinase